MENLNNWIIVTNDFIWTYILIALLICIGIYFTFKSRFVQFRNIREMFRLLGDGIASGNHKNSVSSFQAFCIATASRVGTGNLAGVATALALGGPGAIFWMWLIALIGSASAFIESTLAQIYKVKGDRSFIGGPAFEKTMVRYSFCSHHYHHLRTCIQLGTGKYRYLGIS